jgi:phage tail-like protein
MPAAGSPTFKDAFTTFHFGIEIDGITDCLFDEVTGLDAKMEVFEVKEGGLNSHIHKLPGRISHSPITLKRGMTTSSELWDWYVNVMTKSDRQNLLKDISILQFDQTRTEKQRWNLKGAFPVKWVGPNFKASDSQLAIESIELAYQDLALAKS